MEALNNKIDKISEKIDKLSDSVKFLSDKYDEIKNNIKRVMDNQEILNKSLTKVQKESKIQKLCIVELKERIEFLERGSLESTMNLYPVLVTKEENLREMMSKIGRKIGMDIKDQDIVNIYRKPVKKSGKPGDIIIKYCNQQMKEKVLAGIRKCKLMHRDIGIDCNLGRIYGNEELTTEGKNIYFAALKNKKEKRWKFLWTRGGRIYLKKEEGGNVIRLDTMEVLEQAA